MNSFFRFVISAYLVFSIVQSFNVQLYTPAGPGPITENTVQIFINFEKDVDSIDISKLTVNGFTLSDLKGNGTSWEFTAKFANIAEWGESIVRIPQGVISDISKTDYNSESNTVGVTYGPSRSDNFEDCYDIKSKHPDYKSGLYYITFKGKMDNTLVYCEQKLEGGGWTLFYANSANPKMETKKSYVQYQLTKSIIPFSVNNTYWSYNLGGMIDYTLLYDSVSLMGKDAGPLWEEDEYAYITFPNNEILKQFIEHRLISGTSCQSLSPSGTTIRYRNSNGANYVVQQIENWNGDGYGWKDCMVSPLPEPSDSKVENNPRHIIYNINRADDDQRTRGLFGFTSGDPSVIARYFLRPSEESTRPVVDLVIEDDKSNLHNVPFSVLCQFSNDVYNFEISGIECKECKVMSLVKSPTSDAVYYITVSPLKLSKEKMSIKVLENAAENKNGLKNLPSEEIELILSDDIQHYTIEPEEMNQTCSQWFEEWKSSEKGHIKIEFGIVVSDVFRISFSPTLAKADEHYIIQFNERSSQNSIIYAKGDDESVIDTFICDFGLANDKTAIIHVEYKNNNFTFGTGIDFNYNNTYSFKPENTINDIQYVSFCGGLSTVTYYYPYVGPSSGSENPLSVVLETQSHNPTTKPFTIIGTVSENFKDFDLSKLIISNTLDELTVNVINPRQISIVGNQQTTPTTEYVVYTDVNAFTSYNEKGSMKSNEISITFETTDLKAEITANNIDRADIIPLTVTITFNRDVKSFSIDRIDTLIYECKLSNFKQITSKQFTVDIIPKSIHVRLYIHENKVFDLDGNPNLLTEKDIYFDFVKRYEIPQMNGEFYTFLDTWNSTQVGSIWSTFNVTTSRSLIIALTTGNSITNQRIMIYLGLKDSAGNYNLHRITKIDNGVETILANITKAVGISSSTITPIWFRYDSQTVTIGTGTVIDRNMFLNATNVKLSVQYLSSTSGETKVILDNIDVGERQSRNNPKVFLITDTIGNIRSLPVEIRAIYTEDVLDYEYTFENAEFQHKDVISRSAYEYKYYPKSFAAVATFYIPPCTTIGYSTSLPNTASNELSYSVDFITTYTTYTYLNRKAIWNRLWKFDSEYDLVIRFTVKTESGIEVLFGNDMEQSTVIYRFTFGDYKDDTCKIAFERNGESKLVASIRKNVADPNNDVPLWITVDNTNTYRMGMGSIVDEQVILSYTDMDPIQIRTQYFTFVGDNTTFNNIRTGRSEHYFAVDWIYEKQNPIKTLPVHFVASWNVDAFDFTLQSITSENCKLYNFKEIDKKTYSFDAAFIGENDCRFYIKSGTVLSYNNDKNIESKTVVLYYSEEIIECDLSSENDMKFNLFTEAFKSKNSSQIYSKFSIKCENEILIGFPKDESSTEFYGFYIGNDNNVYISVGWYSLEEIGGKATFHSIEKVACPLCEKDRFVDIWLDVYDDKDNGKTLKIGSGEVMDQNAILKRTDYDHPSMKDTSYITFTNVNTYAFIKNIIVGPGKSDKEKPTVKISTNLLPPFAYLPVVIVIEFSETVSELDRNKIELTNCRISIMVSSNNRIDLSIIPLSSDYPASIHIPAGVVTDLSGNPNEESNILQIIIDDISIFSIFYHDNEQTSYTLWYDQWKSSMPGNILITMESIGDRRCVGMTRDKKEPYPIYDVCLENNLLEIRKLDDELTTTILISIAIDYIRLMWISLDSSKMLKVGKGKEISESSRIASVDLKDYVDVGQLQYVSFMGKGDLVYFSDIIVLPCGSSGVPLPTFKPKVKIPSNIAPIPIDLSFTEPVTGLSLMSFEATNGLITDFEGSGRQFSLNFLPTNGQSDGVLKLLKDVATSRGGFKNPETSINGSYQSELVNFTFNYYPGLYIGADAWKSSSFGSLWATFSVKCENEMTIRLSPWIDGGYPQYNLIFSTSYSFRNYLYRIDDKSRYDVELNEVVVCHKYDSIDYWISQEKDTIRFGKGNIINENELIRYTDSQPVPTNYISFSGGSLPVYYTNITVGPKKESVLNGIMYSRASFPTNVKNIEIFVQWNHNVDDFALEDDVVPTNGIVKNFKVIDRSLYSFIFEPSFCGLGFINIPENSAHYKDDYGHEIGSTEFVPLYIDFCDERPNPVIKGPSELYVSYVPFIISVSFRSSVYGFTSEDITVSQPHKISGFRKINELNYEFEIVVIGNSTEIASLYIDENQLTDIYGNQNTKSMTITLPQYGSMIKSYTITTNMNDSPLYLRQWSTGDEMNTEISFDVNCNNDIHVSFSSELYDSENLYEFMIGVTNNIASRFFINHVLVREIDGPICKPGEFIPMWFSFHKRISKFGLGYIEDGNTKMIYEDETDYHFKYIGLSNYNDPISFRNITIGPVDAMSPRTDITTSAITYITSRNPVEVNISFTNDCLEFNKEMINATSKNIFDFNEINKRLYSFKYVPINGVNSIFIPEGICHDSSNRNNEKSIIYLFEYTKGSFTCKFETSSGQSVSIAPITVSLLFSEATEEFKLDIVTITGGYAFLDDLEHTVDKTVYSFKVYFQDFEPTYLSIDEGVIHDIYNNKISQSEMFLLPRYDDSLIAFTPTTGLNGIPFYTSPWEADARSNIYVKFLVKCAYSAGIGFSKSMSNSKTDDLYEIELGALQNTKTTVRKGLNQKVVKTVESGVCNGLDNDVEMWVECKIGFIRIGIGKEIGKNVILQYEDESAIPVKYVYFTTYSVEASYSNIEIGPKDLAIPYLEMLNVLGQTESIKGTYRLSTHGRLWCVSLIFPSNRPNSEYIMDNGNTTSISNYPTDIFLRGLTAGSQYDVWCYAEDEEGVAISLENMDSVRQIVTVPGGAEYPVITIIYIQGRKTSIYIDFTFDKTGYFYALAVKSGSKAPSIEQIKEKGIRVICTVYDELAVSITDLETMIYYDVYFYSETLYGKGAPMDYVIKNMRTVRTDGSCPYYDGKECAGHGRCDDGICFCEFGYHKSDCSQSCPGLTEDSECNGNGRCSVNIIGTAECVCESFYYGIDCSVHCPNDGRNECGGKDRGTCDRETGECKCKKGYKGYDCSGKTMSVGTIVGIVIGVVAILVIALIVVFLYKTPIRERLNRKKENEYSMFA